MRRYFPHRLAMSAALSVISLTLSMLASPAQAQNRYFDVNGTTADYGIVSGNTYSWDGNNWATATGGTTATGAWTQGAFARFPGGASGTSYTVTVANTEQNVGMIQSVNGVNLTINAIGTGNLEVINGQQGFINGGASAVLTINAPITGSGGVVPQGGGNINLNGANTYSGGTSFTSTATLVHFNNGAAFGTGTITNSFTAASFVPLLAGGGATITLANSFVNGATVANSGFNFASDANTPVVSTGTWNIGSLGMNLRNNGNSTSPLSLTNTISGSSNLVLSGANGGLITFSGANTYSGSTTVGATGATAVTLRLGAANTIASTVSLILAGGTVNPAGLDQAMTSTTLGLTANSILDFGVGASQMLFANSSALTWSGNLNLTGWNPAINSLRFGTDGSGLTAAQLARIQFNGTGLGTARLDASGFLLFGGSGTATPEPGTLVLLGFGFGVAGAFITRRRGRSNSGV